MRTRACRTVVIALALVVPAALLLAEQSALAQDEPLIGGENPPPAPPPSPTPSPTPPPPPPPRPVAAPAPAPTDGNTPRKLKDVTDTDHDMVVKAVGLQVVQQVAGTAFGMPNDPRLTLSEIGVRVWLARKIGLDAGLGLLLFDAGSNIDAQFGLAFTAGVPFALGIYRHVTMFAGPELTFGVGRVNDTTPILLTIAGRAGIELHLGFMDIPRVALSLGFTLGFTMIHVSDNTQILFGTGNAFNFWGLFTTNVGLIFYI